jgi:nucleoside-diphosphate-sugar epimerase
MKPSIGTKHSLTSEFQDSFRDKRILVTGARGFIGKHVVNSLLELGASVQASSRDWTGTVKDDSNLHLLECDLSNFQSTKELVAQSRADIILHLAATVTAQERIELVVPTLNNIVVATVNLLMAATESDCQQFVAVATPEEPTNDLSAASPYAAAKQCASIYFKLFQERYGLPITVVRPFMTFGPGQESSKLIPHTILSLLRKVPPRLSDGARECDFVYVQDVVRGILKASLVPATTTDPLDLGTGRQTSLESLCNQIRKLMNTSVEAQFGVADVRQTREPVLSDIAATKKLIDWEPHWEMEEALEETIRTYRETISV